MSSFISQPRYSQKFLDQAKAERGLMFTLDRDGRFLDGEEGGIRTTVQGVAKPFTQKFLRLAFAVTNGVPLAEAIEHAELSDVIEVKP